ncbi:MAG: hypothetical protein PVJ67_05715 [Candidatus Pacearchaeota archaeon]|jgi:hypothetical protein
MTLQIDDWMTFGIPGEERIIANRYGLNESETPSDDEINSLIKKYKKELEQKEETNKYIELREYHSMWE